MTVDEGGTARTFVQRSTTLNSQPKKKPANWIAALRQKPVFTASAEMKDTKGNDVRGATSVDVKTRVKKKKRYGRR